MHHIVLSPSSKLLSPHPHHDATYGVEKDEQSQIEHGSHDETCRLVPVVQKLRDAVAPSVFDYRGGKVNLPGDGLVAIGRVGKGNTGEGSNLLVREDISTVIRLAVPD